MNMICNTIIFDLDGTLLNTLDDLHDSINYVLNKVGYPLRSIDEIRSFVGNGIELLMNRAVPIGTAPKDIIKCLQLFREYYANHMENKTRPYDGIHELLISLKAEGYQLAIVSNKFDSAVKALCKTYYDPLIQIAIGESPEVAKKPAPDSVYTALSALGSKKEQAIYVGDSEVDVQTAHNAGLKCIGVTWGFRNREVLESVGADSIIDKPSELLKYLNI
jgi:phosphoglycolate phosphatase